MLTNGDRGASDAVVDRVELAAARAGRDRTRRPRSSAWRATRILDIHDGELENTPACGREIVREVRRIRPAMVLTCDPTAWFFGNRYFNHSDHRNAGAVHARRGVPRRPATRCSSKTSLDEGLEPWNVPEVWLGWTMEPNHHQDVTGYIEAKVAALALHASQVADGRIGFFEEWLPKRGRGSRAKSRRRRTPSRSASSSSADRAAFELVSL